MTDGANVLGCPIGVASFVESKVEIAIEEWCNEVDSLAQIAMSQLQAVYSSFVHGIFARWCYFFRTCKMGGDRVSSLEDKLRNRLLVLLTGRDSINDVERYRLFFPSRYGGMGIICPLQFRSSQYSDSVNITRPLVEIPAGGSSEW